MKKIHHFFCFCTLFLFTGCSCTDHRKPLADEKNDEVAEASAVSPKTIMAVAYLKPLKDSKIQGKVTFTKVANGVKIIADVDGLSPGKHGFHIHEYGVCEDDGKTAGAHFNPGKTEHASPESSVRHVGDLGNLIADDEGHAHYQRIDKVISLEGENSIIGRSLIIHADPDDFKTQPAGASGTRICCGVIEAVSQ